MTVIGALSSFREIGEMSPYKTRLPPLILGWFGDSGTMHLVV